MLVKSIGKCQPLTAEALVHSRFLDRRSALRRLARQAAALRPAILLFGVGGASAESNVTLTNPFGPCNLQNRCRRRPRTRAGSRSRSETAAVQFLSPRRLGEGCRFEILRVPADGFPRGLHLVRDHAAHFLLSGMRRLAVCDHRLVGAG